MVVVVVVRREARQAGRQAGGTDAQGDGRGATTIPRAGSLARCTLPAAGQPARGSGCRSDRPPRPPAAVGTVRGSDPRGGRMGPIHLAWMTEQPQPPPGVTYSTSSPTFMVYTLHLIESRWQCHNGCCSTLTAVALHTFRPSLEVSTAWRLACFGSTPGPSTRLPGTR